MLAVRTLLAVFGVPRIDRAGTGWGGGRTARYTGNGGEAVALVLTWDTALDAAQWAAAVPGYLKAAFGTPASRAVAFERSGRRTALVVGPDLARARALAHALTGH